MSKRISTELNKILKENRNCFNCTFFKIKPFKLNKLNNGIDIDFKLTTNTGRCIKDKFNTNTGVRSSIVSKTNKSVILRDALKSINRYKIMAENCDKYDGEETILPPQQKKQNKRTKYKLVKYLF